MTIEDPRELDRVDRAIRDNERREFAREFPDAFAWRTEPYEFVSDRLAIDLLYGNSDFRQHVEAGTFSLKEVTESWQADLDTFQPLRQQFLMY